MAILLELLRLHYHTETYYEPLMSVSLKFLSKKGIYLEKLDFRHYESLENVKCKIHFKRSSVVKN